MPFTGSTSKYYELTKPEMKMVAYYKNIRTARFAVCENGLDARERCADFTFPRHRETHLRIFFDRHDERLQVHDLGGAGALR